MAVLARAVSFENVCTGATRQNTGRDYLAPSLDSDILPRPHDVRLWLCPDSDPHFLGTRRLSSGEYVIFRNAVR